MRASLIINGLEFGPFIKEEGIQVSKVVKKSSSLTTLSGALDRKEFKRININVTLIDNIRDYFELDGNSEGFYKLMQKLKGPLAEVSYANFYTGKIIDGLFYINDLNDSIKKSYANESVIGSCTFLLDEKYLYDEWTYPEKEENNLNFALSPKIAQTYNAFKIESDLQLE